MAQIVNISDSAPPNANAHFRCHPVKEQLPDVQYCVNSPPPWLEAIILGFQHYILSLGATVMIPSIIVPQMGGNDYDKARVIQNLLFVSGVSTLLQTFFGTRLPIVAVGSAAYIVPTLSIVYSSKYQQFTNSQERFLHTIRAIQGALMFAAFFQMAMGFLNLWRNVVRFLSPLSVVPVITFTGAGLYYFGFPTLAKCIEIGLPGLIVMVVISQYLPHYLCTKGSFYSKYAVLFTVAGVWLYAQILTSSQVYNHKSENTQMTCRTDRAGLVSTSPWISLPHPFQWGSPTFTASEAFIMVAASFVSIFESTGSFFAAARYGSATPVPSSVISRGVGWLGLGVLLNGIFGSVIGMTTSAENVGLLALTKVGSRRVIQISAVFMIFFSVFGKFGAVFASIPLSIVAALNCVLLCYVCSVGLGFLQFCNLNSFRTKFILGFSIFMGISVAQYSREYAHIVPNGDLNLRWLGNFIIVFLMSHATVASLAALILDNTLRFKNEEVPKDNGMFWWEKFSLYKSDARTDEFYALPFNLDKLFPSL